MTLLGSHTLEMNCTNYLQPVCFHSVVVVVVVVVVVTVGIIVFIIIITLFLFFPKDKNK